MFNKNNDDWREKYEQVVESFEQKSAAYKSMIHDLRDCLAKVSIAGNGLNSNLDRSLAKLRQEIRKGAKHTALQAQIETIAATLRHMQDEVPERIDANLSQKILAPFEAVNTKNLPSPVAKALQSLRADVKKSESLSAEDAVGLLQEFLASIFVLLTEQGEDKNEKTGFWSKLTGGSDDALIKQIAENITTIIDNLSVPDEAQAKLEALTQRVNYEMQLSDLAEVISLLMGLIIEIHALETKQTQDFLENFATTMDGMQNAFGDLHANAHESKQNSEALGSGVQNEIGAIRDQISPNATLGDVIKTVGTHLDNINQTVTTFRSKEQEISEKSLEKINMLETQLEQSQHQIGELNQSLSQQRHLAQSDTLTGLPNREAYNDYQCYAEGRWKRGYGDLCLVVADIDNFKKINDTFGHLAGDKVLKKVAGILKSSLRSADFIARYGGEEFVLILEKTDLVGTKTLMEKLRAAVEACQFHFRDKRVKITLSFGVAQLSEKENFDDLFARADAALYSAKDEGRNCVKVSESGPDN